MVIAGMSPSVATSPLFALVPIVIPRISTSVLFYVFVTSEVAAMSPTLALSPAFALVSLVIPNEKTAANLPTTTTINLTINTTMTFTTRIRRLLLFSLFAIYSPPGFAFYLLTFANYFVSASGKVPFAIALTVLPSVS